MDDHRSWQRDYAVAVRREWAERALVAGLALAICVAGAGVLHNWTTRHERIFRPVAGLSYEAPQSLGGSAISAISEPLTFQKLSPNDAYRFNASVPVTTGPLAPSRPFVLSTGLPAADAVRALDCLTAAVYYEAASESLAGQQAVAQVVLNRVRHPAFPNSVCGVVFSGSTRKTGCQFTFTCDGSLARRPREQGWLRARSVARAALTGYVAVQVGQATHYHTLWVAPYWSPSLDKVANIGAHTFYRWKGVTGRPEAFNSPYAGAEPAFSLTLQSPPVDPLAEAASEAVTAASDPVAIAPPAAAAAPAVPTPRIDPAAAAIPDTPPPPPALAAPAPMKSAPTAIEPERKRRIAAPAW